MYKMTLRYELDKLSRYFFTKFNEDIHKTNSKLLQIFSLYTQ